MTEGKSESIENSIFWLWREKTVLYSKAGKQFLTEEATSNRIQPQIGSNLWLQIAKNATPSTQKYM